MAVVYLLMDDVFFFDILVCMLPLTLSTEKKQVNPIKFIHG